MKNKKNIIIFILVIIIISLGILVNYTEDKNWKMISKSMREHYICKLDYDELDIKLTELKEKYANDISEIKIELSESKNKIETLEDKLLYPDDEVCDICKDEDYNNDKSILVDILKTKKDNTPLTSNERLNIIIMRNQGYKDNEIKDFYSKKNIKLFLNSLGKNQNE